MVWYDKVVVYCVEVKVELFCLSVVWTIILGMLLYVKNLRAQKILYRSEQGIDKVFWLLRLQIIHLQLLVSILVRCRYVILSLKLSLLLGIQVAQER